MRVFVTGATGFIGRAVVRELLEAGHHVTGLARSDAAARLVDDLGAHVHRGSLEDLESLRRGASAAEAAIHTAFFHEFTHASVPTRLRVMLGGAPSGIVSRFMRATVETDRRAIATIGRALAGSDRAFVVACGTMSLRPGRLASEDDAPDPQAVGGRRLSEAAAMETLADGVRASVVRLPPVVHGDDDRSGFVPRLIGFARKTGTSAMVGAGDNRWPAVHRLDAARLFRLALERGVPGGRYHAIGEEAIPFRTIAEAIGRKLDIPVAGISAAQAAKSLSWLAPFVSVDNPTSSALTRQRLGWQPTGPTLMADFEGRAYLS